VIMIVCDYRSGSDILIGIYASTCVMCVMSDSGFPLNDRYCDCCWIVLVSWQLSIVTSNGSGRVGPEYLKYSDGGGSLWTSLLVRVGFEGGF
jgi:hypothetical protein